MKSIDAVEKLIEGKRDELSLIGKTDRAREKALFNLDLERKSLELSAAEIDRAKTAYAELVDAIADANQNRDVARSFAEPFGQGVEEAILHFDNLRDAALGVFEDIRRASVRALVTQPLTEQISGGLGSLFQGANLFGSARGNVFSGGSVLPFSEGGIVDRLTYYPMADGRTAAAGESRPEGIFPLMRDSGGRLGVSAVGGGRSVVIHQTFHFGGSRADVDTFRRSARQVAADIKRTLNEA